VSDLPAVFRSQPSVAEVRLPRMRDDRAEQAEDGAGEESVGADGRREDGGGAAWLGVDVLMEALEATSPLR